MRKSGFIFFQGEVLRRLETENTRLKQETLWGFGLPQPPHHLRNPFSEELIYLVGGEKVNFDVGVFPRHGKRAIRNGDTAYIIDESSLQDFGSSKAVDIEQDQEYL